MYLYFAFAMLFKLKGTAILDMSTIMSGYEYAGKQSWCFIKTLIFYLIELKQAQMCTIDAIECYNAIIA